MSLLLRRLGSPCRVRDDLSLFNWAAVLLHLVRSPGRALFQRLTVRRPLMVKTLMTCQSLVPFLSLFAVFHVSILIIISSYVLFRKTLFSLHFHSSRQGVIDAPRQAVFWLPDHLLLLSHRRSSTCLCVCVCAQAVSSPSFCPSFCPATLLLFLQAVSSRRWIGMRSGVRLRRCLCCCGIRCSL